MNDTTRRFLNAIVDKIPAGGEIVELRLFPAIKQGGMESGVAVLAVETTAPVAAEVDATGDGLVAPDDEFVGWQDSGDQVDVPVDVLVDVLVDVPVDVPVDVLVDTPVDVPVGVRGDPLHDSVDADVIALALVDDTPIVDAVDVVEVVELAERTTLDANDASPYADDSADAATGDVVLDVMKTPAAPFKRYAMLTARYRLVLKGPDRGRWEMEVTHEADAPLATLERVARGVAKRAGEDSDPEHFSAHALRSALDAPAWVTIT